MIADTNTIHTNPTKPTRRSCQLAEPDVAAEADSDAADVEFVGFDPISSSIIGAVGDTIPASAVDAGWLSDVAVVAFTSNSESESEAVADLECFLVPLENNSGDLVRILEV
jgi:hypothetical protein